MTYKAINLIDKLSLINEHWSPGIIAELNDYEIKLVKISGEFTWHSHQDTDELFICLGGEMKIAFRDGEVALKEGEMYVVPKGVEHKPSAAKECRIMLIEPRGVINTGDGPANELTATGVRKI